MEEKIDDNSSNSIKLSPNYEQQLDEIDLLNNIIPEKITILKEEPNINIQIEIEANDTESKIKKFILIIYLNFDYPEKSPKFQLYEVNNYLNDKNKEKIEKKLNEYCEENIGFPVIYQLYEICQEFANEEEKLAILQKNEEDKEENPYELNKLNKIKALNDIPIDVILLKNGNVLIINEKNNIKIYDNKLESIKLETFDYHCYCTYCKYIPSDSEKESDYLYCFTNKQVQVYQISYLPKKTFSDTNYKVKISGNVMIEYINKIEFMTDVIEFDNFENSAFFINNQDASVLFYKYNKQKKNMHFDKKYITNKFKTFFRKLYKINSEKFIIASYTLKSYDKETYQYKIEGKNIMVFVDNCNFKISKTHNIKISPLNNTICNYKNKYIILSYFDTVKENKNKKKKKKNKEEQYNFENNDFNSAFHEVEYIKKKREDRYAYYDYYDYYDDYEYEPDQEEYDEYVKNYFGKFDNKYFSYDITEHLIGIFNIKTEELVTIYEFDPIKILYNIKDNILCLAEKRKDKRKVEQIANERMIHSYFNELSLGETNSSDLYKRDNYIAFLQFGDGLIVCQENFDYSNITSFVESDKDNLIIASKKKGIILYSK